MNLLSTRLKLYRLATAICGLDAAGSWGAAFSASLAVCAHEDTDGAARMTASARVETRMATSCEQRWDARSLAPTRDRLNPRKSFRSAQPDWLSSLKIPAFFPSYQSLMPQ